MHPTRLHCGAATFPQNHPGLLDAAASGTPLRSSRVPSILDRENVGCPGSVQLLLHLLFGAPALEIGDSPQSAQGKNKTKQSEQEQGQLFGLERQPNTVKTIAM
jgi:hypothetical protein